MKIAITGSHGFIGCELQSFLREKGYEIIPLKRGHYHNVDADVIINLAGENIFGRWSDKKKKKILESRIETARDLSSNCPQLFINASAIGYYGNRGKEKLTEMSGPGLGFLAEVCKRWEGAVRPNCRIVYARFGLVLSPKGGALKKMLGPFKWCLGGRLGSGTQIWSWIALEDLLEAIYFIMGNNNVSGAVNFTSPEPLSNRSFTKILSDVLHRPEIAHVPAFVLKLVFGQAADEIFLSSQNVYPEKLLQNGFKFRYSHLKQYLEEKL